MIKKNSNTSRSGSRTRSTCETEKKIVTNICFCFWSVWPLNHTCGHSIGIWESTKRILGLGNL